MTSARIEIDATDALDGMAPVWTWRVLIDGRTVAEGTEPFFPLAHRIASAALLGAA